MIISPKFIHVSKKPHYPGEKRAAFNPEYIRLKNTIQPLYIFFDTYLTIQIDENPLFQFKG